MLVFTSTKVQHFACRGLLVKDGYGSFSMLSAQSVLHCGCQHVKFQEAFLDMFSSSSNSLISLQENDSLRRQK
jgi:hypothetical protein